VFEFCNTEMNADAAKPSADFSSDACAKAGYANNYNGSTPSRYDPVNPTYRTGPTLDMGGRPLIGGGSHLNYYKDPVQTPFNCTRNPALNLTFASNEPQILSSCADGPLVKVHRQVTFVILFDKSCCAITCKLWLSLSCHRMGLYIVYNCLLNTKTLSVDFLSRHTRRGDRPVLSCATLCRHSPHFGILANMFEQRADACGTHDAGRSPCRLTSVLPSIAVVYI
jgi:hypothetical protein